MNLRNLARTALKRALDELEDRGRTTYIGTVKRVNIYPTRIDKLSEMDNEKMSILDKTFFPDRTVLTLHGVGKLVASNNNSLNVFTTPDPKTKKARVHVRLNGERELRAIEAHKIFGLEIHKDDGTKYSVVPADYDYLIGSFNKPVKFTVSTRQNALLTERAKEKLKKFYLISRSKNGYVIADRLRNEGFSSRELFLDE